MITTLTKVLTNPTLVNVAQNTDATVSTKVAMNTIGRPAFILADKNISSDTKKFAATKEILYQTTCLATYLLLIVPVFKKLGFKLAKEKIFKNTQGFEYFKNLKEYSEYREMTDILDLSKRNEKVEKLHKKKNMNFCPEIKQELKKETPNKYSDIQGAINLSNIIGSIIGLSIISPKVSNILIDPALKFFNMNNKPNS